MPLKVYLTLLGTMLALSAGVACNNSNNSDNTSDAGTHSTQDAGPNDAGEPIASIDVDAGVPQLSDGQILQVLITGNNGEIAQAQSAQAHATHDDVKAFAARMISDHTAANQTLTTLAQAQSLSPAASALNTQVDAEGQQGNVFVSSQAGAAFDLAYMDLQVKMHAALLTLGDAVLMGEVQNAALKTALMDIRNTTQMHLTDAVTLQGTLAPATP